MDTFHVSVESSQSTHISVETFYTCVETIYTLWKHSMILWGDWEVPTSVWEHSTYVWKHSTLIGGSPNPRGLGFLNTAAPPGLDRGFNRYPLGLPITGKDTPISSKLRSPSPKTPENFHHFEKKKLKMKIMYTCSESPETMSLDFSDLWLGEKG